MNNQQKDNEAKIFDAIQKLKDSVFGLNNSYVDYCYSKLDGKYIYDSSKVERFINELLACAKKSANYSEAYDEAIIMFFEITIEFISKACNFEEQQFISLRKIAKTTEKYSNEHMSTFDALIDASKDYFDEPYLNNCLLFSRKMVDVQFDKFYSTIKHSIEIFIDTKNLNVLSSERDTANLIMRINRTANIIAIETKRFSEINGVYDYE